MALAALYGRLPKILSGAPVASSSAFQVSMKSPSTSLKEGFPPKSRASVREKPWSISKTVTARPRSRARAVIAPMPGPISHTRVPASALSSSSTLSRERLSTRKFWPKRLDMARPSAARRA